VIDGAKVVGSVSTRGAPVSVSYDNGNGCLYIDEKNLTAICPNGVYTQTFSETGLPAGTGWTVTFNNTTESNLGDLSFGFISAGEHRFSVGAESGYVAFPRYGELILGANATQPVSFTAVSPLQLQGGATPATGPIPLTVTFELYAAGGLPPYTYAVRFGDGTYGNYSNDGTGLITHTYVSVGAYLVTVVLNDSANESVSTSFTIYATALALVVAPPVATPPTVDLGQTTTLNVSVSGGAGVYTYQWLGLPTPCISVNASSITCTPSAVGTSAISVLVVTSEGEELESNATSLRVVAPVAIQSATDSPSSIDIGMASDLAVALASSGTGGLVYDWTGLPPGCPATDSDRWSCYPDATGMYEVRVTVTDATGLSVSQTLLPLNVAPALVVTTPTQSRSSADVGQAVTFTASVSGGVAPYGYTWIGADVGCRSGASTLTCNASAAPDLTLAVQVTDANHNLVQSTAANVTVYPAVSVELSILPGQVVSGRLALLTVTVRGGSGPYEIAFRGLPAGCTSENSTSLNCTPSVDGQYGVNVTVTDRLGEESIANATLRVVAPPAPASTAELEVGGGVAVLAAILVVAVVLLRRRRTPAG
jgi:hypothetical protein